MLLCLTVLLLSSCSGVFDIHPYDVNVHGEKDINAKQMKVIESKFADKKTLRVASSAILTCGLLMQKIRWLI